jgi:hypothetical protein
MTPTLIAPREKICQTCRHYGWKKGNPRGWRWACCLRTSGVATPFWFPDSEEKPGERKGCEEWE